MEFIECDVPQGQGYCCDNDCDCGITPIDQGSGLVFISKDVVDFRNDALTRDQLREKLAIRSGDTYVPVASYEPILICEKAARTRGIDLDVAAQDAQMFWSERKVPCRPTPPAGSVPPTPVPSQASDTPPMAPPVPPLPSQPESAPPVGSASFVDDEPIEEHSIASEPPIEPQPSVPDQSSTPAQDQSVDTSSFVDMSENDPLPEDARVSDVTAIGPPPSMNLPSSQSNTQSSPPPSPGKTDSISAEDVASAYADGPLAELAAKMAADQNPSPPKKTSKTTAISPSPFLEPDPPEGPESNSDASFAESPAGKKKKSILVPVIVVGVLLAGLSAGLVFWTITKGPDLRKQPEITARPAQSPATSRTSALESALSESENDPMETISSPASEPPAANASVAQESGAEPPIAQEASFATPPSENTVTQSPPPASTVQSPKADNARLTPAFFTKTYRFRDKAYFGTIRFFDISGTTGSYQQAVSPMGSNKVYNVTGSFVFDGKRITFSPNGASTNVIWELENLGEKESSFFDPRQANRADGRVVLSPE